MRSGCDAEVLAADANALLAVVDALVAGRCGRPISGCCEVPEASGCDVAAMMTAAGVVTSMDDEDITGVVLWGSEMQTVFGCG